MAIYHLSAKIVSRATGRSAVGAAAYRSGESLHDQRTGQTFDYTYKSGVEYSEILAPPEAPAWVHDREVLWNAVEQVERRKDAQLAREIEIGLPIELDKDQQVALLRDYVAGTFVSRGMVADVALHLDNPDNPHAHVLLTTRQMTPEGFGAKRRDWNVRSELREWRAAWAGTANQHLARAGLDIRIDHRTLEAQGIDLVPGRKLGLSLERQQSPSLPEHLAEKVAEQRGIAAENGQRIIQDPTLALTAMTHSQPTFTERDIAKYLHTRTNGAEQFQSAYLKVTTSAELVPLGIDDRGRTRFTTQERVDLERGMLGKRDVLVIDEAGLIGTRQLAHVLERAEAAGSKVVLVGNPEQLQTIEAGAAFRGIAALHGGVELTEVWRQKTAWQREATQQFFCGRTAEALEAYERDGSIRAAATRGAAREALLAAWSQAGREHPGESRLMLAYTRDDVRQLNTQARELRRAAGELGQGEVIPTERGAREFAAGDRLYFMQNDRDLGVKNGTLGTVETIRDSLLQVRLDGEEGRRVAVDSKHYRHLEHGYAATIHKAQSVSVDRTYTLATPYFDRHSTYVAMSRHRESATVFYGQEDFQPHWSRASAAENFKAMLSRDRSKDLAPPAAGMTAAERLRQRADRVAQRLAAEREQQQPHQTLEQQHTERQKQHTLEQEIEQRKLDHDHGLEF